MALAYVEACVTMPFGHYSYGFVVVTLEGVRDYYVSLCALGDRVGGYQGLRVRYGVFGFGVFTASYYGYNRFAVRRGREIVSVCNGVVRVFRGGASLLRFVILVNACDVKGVWFSFCYFV